MTQTIPLAGAVLKIYEAYSGKKWGHIKHPSKMPLGASCFLFRVILIGLLNLRLAYLAMFFRLRLDHYDLRRRNNPKIKLMKN